MVICAVDFGASAHRLMEYAVSIATTAGARLIRGTHSLEWSEEQDKPPITRTLTAFLRPKMTLLRGSVQLITSEMRACCRPELAVGYGSPG